MKAQLILVGGRLIPNILSVLYQQPALIVAVCSHQSHTREWPQLRKAIQNLVPSCHIVEKVVDGYLLEQIEAACESELWQSAEDEWVFNVTNATSIMSIGAYNIARKYISQINIDCWFIDTPRSRVVALIGNAAEERIFDLKVDQYVAAHDCRLVAGSLDENRENCENKWLPFTQSLIAHPPKIDVLKKFIKKVSNEKPKKGEGAREIIFPGCSEEMVALFADMYDVGLFDNLKREKGSATVGLSYLQANYLEGPWLEEYVWNEARQLGIFSDCLWNQRLIPNKQLTDKDSKNELDVSLIYKAQLFIVECKTGENEGFKSDILYKLDSIANPLGNWSVGKMLVISLPIPDKQNHTGYKQFEEFKDKAEERGIMLVTRETLPDVGAILRKLAEEPKFNR